MVRFRDGILVADIGARTGPDIEDGEVQNQRDQ